MNCTSKVLCLTFEVFLQFYMDFITFIDYYKLLFNT